jgi:hypothetical protein
MKDENDAKLKYFQDTFFKSREIQKVKILASIPNPKIEINLGGSENRFNRNDITIDGNRWDEKYVIGRLITEGVSLQSSGISGKAVFDYNENDSILYLILCLYSDNSRDVFQVDLDILSSIFIDFIEV